MERLVDRFLRDEILALSHFIPIPGMHTRLESLWKRLIICSGYGLRRLLISRI